MQHFLHYIKLFKVKFEIDRARLLTEKGILVFNNLASTELTPGRICTKNYNGPQGLINTNSQLFVLIRLL